MDITNITKHQPSNRHCMEKAEQCMSARICKPCKPRGDPTGGGKARWSTSSTTDPPNNPQSEVDQPVDTLKRILMHDRNTFVEGFELVRRTKYIS